ncbi:MAG: shikimate dehydrogenase [Verrucomicrobiota bacterium]|jgi:shikimate dehydrogenase
MKNVYTLEDLRNWAEITRDLDPPIRLGVFGDPVAHSLSPQLQNAALKHDNIEMQYARFHIHADELREALRLAQEWQFTGLNFTVPHKIAAVGLMDSVDEPARKIGAVNTVRIVSGALEGFNTDGEGFGRAIRDNFAIDLRDLRVLVLGAGGAARAIAFHCASDRCERLVIVNRDSKKAKQLVDELRPDFVGPRVLGPAARLEAVPWDESAIRSQLPNLDLIVNATPLGLQPRDPSPIAARALAPHLMVFDTVYGTGKTALVRAAEEAGARAADGRLMLLHQGAAAFEIWFERPAPLDEMRNAIRQL